MPINCRPHIACLPQELHNKIQGYSDHISLAILSVTCKAMRIRLPHDPDSSATFTKKDEEDEEEQHHPLEDEIRIQGRVIKMHELLKEYMHDGLGGLRLYCGHYNVFKFLTMEQYAEARDFYWAKYPQLPWNYAEEIEELRKKAKAEEERKLERLNDWFESENLARMQAL